jgi:hypothetical protein
MQSDNTNANIAIDLNGLDKKVLIDIILRANNQSPIIQKIVRDILKEIVNSKEELMSRTILDAWNQTESD